jgi:hypothetical protein
LALIDAFVRSNAVGCFGGVITDEDLLPNGLAADPVADMVDALWMMLRFAAHETRVGTEPLLGLPDRRTVRLGTVGETDADVYGDFSVAFLPFLISSSVQNSQKRFSATIILGVSGR